MPAAELDVVLCVDANYALPLAVTLTSLDRAAEAGTTIRAHVLHSGLTAPAKERVVRGLTRVDVSWVEIADAEVRGAHFPDWISAATLYRLRLGELLPTDVGRVLYLDSDIVVTGPLTAAAGLDLRGAAVGAVRDAGNPFPARGDRPAWRELGATPSAPYFNAGVLLIDVPRWRAERVGERCLEILRRTRPFFADQDALNAVLEGAWTELPRRWNVQTNDLADGPSWALDRADVQAAIDSPLVVHFTERVKPWHVGSTHPRRELWYAALAESGWAGWQPRPSRVGIVVDRASTAARALRQRLRSTPLPRE